MSGNVAPPQPGRSVTAIVPRYRGIDKFSLYAEHGIRMAEENLRVSRAIIEQVEQSNRLFAQLLDELQRLRKPEP